jgi:hypothetical protein
MLMPQEPYQVLEEPYPKFTDHILALDEALKTRTKHMHDMEIAFQTTIVYRDHRWKS